MGKNEIAASMGVRAELARRLSEENKEPGASAALREIADELRADADKLEDLNVIPLKPPLNDD